MKDRKYQCAPYLGPEKGFSHQVRVGRKVIALTSNEDYGHLLALTIKRSEMLADLSKDHSSILSVLVDLITYIQKVEFKRKEKQLKRRPAKT